METIFRLQTAPDGPLPFAELKIFNYHTFHTFSHPWGPADPPQSRSWSVYRVCAYEKHSQYIALSSFVQVHTTHFGGSIWSQLCNTICYHTLKYEDPSVLWGSLRWTSGMLARHVVSLLHCDVTRPLGWNDCTKHVPRLSETQQQNNVTIRSKAPVIEVLKIFHYDLANRDLMGKSIWLILQQDIPHVLFDTSIFTKYL